MEIKDLAPWLAVAITLALSILVPLFTQIANNRFQLKQKEKEYQRAKEDEIRQVFFEFSEKVGACVAAPNFNNMQEAGAQVSKMYLYYPESMWEDLDKLNDSIFNEKFKETKFYLTKINKEVAKMINVSKEN